MLDGPTTIPRFFSSLRLPQATVAAVSSGPTRFEAQMTNIVSFFPYLSHNYKSQVTLCTYSVLYGIGPLAALALPRQGGWTVGPQQRYAVPKLTTVWSIRMVEAGEAIHRVLGLLGPLTTTPMEWSRRRGGRIDRCPTPRPAKKDKPAWD